MLVNNLKIPQLLEELITKSIWEKLKCNDLLKNLVKSDYPDEYTFLSTANMQGMTEVLLDIYNSGNDSIYGLTTDSDNKIQTGKIDLTKAIIIISNSEEEAICLDYSESIRTPRVLASYFKDGKYIVWEEIATSFENFMDKTGLNPMSEE